MINEEHTYIPQHIKPRLRHIEPGQFFTLKNGGTHLLLNKGYRYGYIEDGKISLCAELCPERSSVVFGDGAGWRSRNAE